MVLVLYFCVYLASASASLRAKVILQQDTLNITNIIHAFRFTLGHIFCVQVMSDGSDFGNRLMRSVHYSSRSLVNSFEEVCSGFFLAASDLLGLESLLTKFKRWAKHRMLCILPHLPEQDFQNFLQARVNLFRDAEVFIAKSECSVGYQLSHTIRRFMPIRFEGKHWLPEKESTMNFNKREITVTTFNCSTFSEINYPHTDGSEMEIFLEIANRLNLSYKFIVPYGGKYPLGLLQNGKWQGGLLGLLASNQADVGFCGLWISYNKVKTGIEMSTPFRRICLKYLVPRPVPLNAEWYGIFSPYSLYVWLSILIAFLLISLLLPLITYLDSMISSYGCCSYLSFGNSWMVVGGILMQGNWVRSTMRQGPCRHLIAWWTVFSLLIGSGFSGSLASYWTRPVFTAKPESVKDLVNGGFHWTATRQPFVDTLFNLNDPVYVEWAKRIRVVVSNEDLHDALRGQNQVICGFQMYGVFSLLDEDIPEDILEGYEVTSDCFSEFYTGFAFREGSPYLNFFNEQLTKMREVGLVHRAMKVSLERWMKKRKYMYQVAQLSKNNYHRAVLTLASLKGIFEFWSSGLLIATVVFIFELMSNRMAKVLQSFLDSSKHNTLKNSLRLCKGKQLMK